MSSQGCSHGLLQHESSNEAKKTGYKQPTRLQRLAATLPSGEAPTKSRRPMSGLDASNSPSTFPAPLVLPGDEISWTPNYRPQSMKSWIGNRHRNEVTQERRTLYVVPPPVATSSVDFVKDWAKPRFEEKMSSIKNASRIPDDLLLGPRPKELQAYLEAFYHPLPVEILPGPRLKFVPFATLPGTVPAGEKYIGLQTSTEVYGIRHRPSKDGVFAGQFDLMHLLDVAVSLLPKDAYALLMMTDHDLYEDDEDDFCCGRAYGGSRVSVVSTSRYNPLLDELQNVEREHAWPASHCREYGDTCCRNAGTEPDKMPTKKTKAKSSQSSAGAIPFAVAAYVTSRDWRGSTTASLESLWLCRVLKTASHEIGHCFCLGHCVYYACVMQGTTGLTEDARQPPYLCPVDLAKVLYATGGRAGDRYRKLVEYCEEFSSRSGRDSGMLNAFAAWLGVRLAQVETGSSVENAIMLD